MAIYRMEVKIIGRSGGRSACAAAAYRAGSRLRDERLGKTHDYRKRAANVLYSEILTPESSPGWVYDRETLWNKVEAREDLGTRPGAAQLARELVLTLPRELSLDDNIQLVKNYVNDCYVSRGMIADCAIHDAIASDGKRNPHAHVLLTMRPVDGDDFGKKAREWNPVFKSAGWVAESDELKALRGSWAGYVNNHLAACGVVARVDHRSNAEQGLNREPEPKLGKAKYMAAKGGPAAARAAVQDRTRWINKQRVMLDNAAFIDPARERARLRQSAWRPNAKNFEYHGRVIEQQPGAHHER